jgi:hypothetical protein
MKSGLDLWAMKRGDKCKRNTRDVSTVRTG